MDRAHRPGPNTSSSSSVVVAAGPTPAATFELAVDAARAGAISLDDPASLIGPVGSLVAVAYIARVVWTGTETIKRLKAELTAEGYDVDEFNKVGELKAIRNAVDNGTVDGIYDKVWYNRLVMSAGAGSITDVQKAKAYWRKRGVTVNTLADIVITFARDDVIDLGSRRRSSRPPDRQNSRCGTRVRSSLARRLTT